MFPLNVIAAAGVSPVQIQTTGVVDLQLSGTAQVGLRLNSSGNEQVRDAGVGYITVGPWLLLGAVNQYEVRYSPAGDVPTGSAINTWLALSATRTWEQVQVGIGILTCTGPIEIRRVSNSAIVLSQSLALTAQVTP